MTIPPRNCFLIDGVGALVTASSLGLLLAPFESLFGMPSRIVYVLAIIAAAFAMYSLVCYLIQPSNWPVFLRVIAVANLSYSVLTILLLFVYRLEVTALGIAYFIGEIIVVSALAIYELITARRAVGL